MEYDLAFLAKGASQMGIELNEKALSQFHRYLSMLLEWNERFNLTAITDPQEVMVHHFMDSISILKLKRVKTQDTLLDLGTGAGLPGIPIKILLPECRMTLVDSVNKKTQFLREVIRELGLEHVEVIHARAEDLGTEAMRREAFDIVVSRAVAELRVLAEYCLPFVRLGGSSYPIRDLGQRRSPLTQRKHWRYWGVNRKGSRGWTSHSQTKRISSS